MKAKRLTALALAALMTASGTSVAFAKESANSDYDLDFVSSSGDYYYGYDEDENAIIKKKPSEFQPGDTIYIPLLEDSDEKFNNSRGKNFTVYIDGNKFDVGDSYVDDVGVVRKRGYITIPGTTTTTYKFSLANTFLSGYDGRVIENATSKDDALTKGRTILKNDIGSIISSAMPSYVKTVYVYNGTPYKTIEEAKKAAEKDNPSNSWERVESYWKVDGSELKDLPTNYLSAKGGYVYKDGDAFYYTKSLPEALEKIDFTQYTGEIPTQLYYTDVNSKDQAYGTLTDTAPVDNADDMKVYVPTVENPIWIKNNNDGTYQFVTGAILDENVNTATGGLAQFAAEQHYYDSTNNSVHWVEEINQPAYFTTDGQFVNLVANIPTTQSSNVIVENPNGYIVNDQAYTDADKAREAIKLDVNNRIDNLNTSCIREDTTTGQPTTVRDFGYWAYIDTKKSTTTKDIDIVGKIYVGTSKSDAEDEPGFYVDVTLTNKDVGNKDYIDVDSDAYIEPGQRAVLSFADDADDVVIEFGDDAYYEFNARGQGRVNFAYNTNFDRDFAYDYDHANIDFINFVAEPTTNKTGTLYIYADEDSYIYEVTSKGAKKINGAYYDDDEGAWVIRTRHLTSYAISDRRLKTIDQMEDDKNSSSSSKPSGSQGSGSGNGNYKPIPDTGR